MIELVIDAHKKNLGGGLEVGRVLPFHKRRMVGPFIFLDHMGPADFLPGQGVDVRPHPHIGLSTVTYLFQGEIHHRDNLGYDQVIVPGEVNWMTAGRGIVHSERTDPDRKLTGARMHGMQAWVALPLEHEETEPAFANYKEDALPTYENDGLWARLVAGTAFGAEAKVKTHSPLFYIHWELQPGVKTAPPVEHEERAIYVAQGRVEVAGREFGAGQMVVFETGGQPIITALDQSTVMCLGGANIGSRIIWWNLVASDQQKIEEAKADWANIHGANGRFTLPPTDDQEFIPLPEEPKPPERMS
jgi:redox-sensitive bicupin YhaK (pirin superfamily)